MVKYFCLIFVLIVFVGCSPDKEDSFQGRIAEAHHKQQFLEEDIIAFDFLLTFNGEERMNASFYLTTDSRKGFIEQEENTDIYFVDRKVYCERDATDKPKVRFDAFTWSYFFMLPYKLDDPGTIWTDYKNKQLDGTTYDVRKLTFEKGTGDAPDDWYILYAHEGSNLLEAAAYIVTYSKSKEVAEQNPHAIRYEEYRETFGIPLSHQWTFWGWDKSGKLTHKIGEAALDNFRFLREDEVDFNPPAEFVEI